MIAVLAGRRLSSASCFVAFIVVVVAIVAVVAIKLAVVCSCRFLFPGHVLSMGSLPLLLECDECHQLWVTCGLKGAGGDMVAKVPIDKDKAKRQKSTASKSKGGFR